jgi:hypothetical protein
MVAVRLRAEPVDEVGQRDQAVGGERAPTVGDHDERIVTNDIGPAAGSENSLPSSSRQ